MTNTIVKIFESMVKGSNTIVLMTMTNISETETIHSVSDTAFSITEKTAGGAAGRNHLTTQSTTNKEVLPCLNMYVQ
jgi:hypothetical protein